MISKTTFLEEEIPYQKLEKLGISKKKLLNMPREVIEPLISGRITPLVMAKYEAKNNKVLEIPMKLQLTRGDDGKVNLMTYQVRKEIDRDSVRLSENELQKIKDGESIRKEIKEDGVRKQKYVQLDPETKSLILKDAHLVKISEKLKEMEKINDIELGTNQKLAAVEGKPVELAVGDRKVTVGVDLKEPQGFKVVSGDMKEWERQMKIKYDHEHEGFMGYVMTDENRWDYQKVVDKLTHKEEHQFSLKKEEEESSGLKL